VITNSIDELVACWFEMRRLKAEFRDAEQKFDEQERRWRAFQERLGVSLAR
jgi:hypothetical protein